MIQAEQQALFQTQNQEVLRIRQAELDYYMNFYGNFGTQAALMVGFVLNTLTNLIPNIETWHDQVFADLFFISTALSFIFGMHALLNNLLMCRRCLNGATSTSPSWMCFQQARIPKPAR